MALSRETSAGYLANWAARLFARELDRQLQPTGIAPAYMPVMFALGDGGTLTQKELARRAAVEQPTMAATLNRMERDGFISRRPDPGDRRSALVVLTPSGLALLPEVERVVHTINALALASLSSAEQAAFFAAIGKIIAALEHQDPALAPSTA
ncbi:MarR family transcriptional regulator [Devosia sp. 919]|uniref:MarR family winged helix-turn-helix transcriptional regulator n=1 Tax=Devosia sp. 919 TaxID=2726065 RepID=UPI001551F1C4|nr:MarR family transcriptional regulator [Devosia sp. 919]